MVSVSQIITLFIILNSVFYFCSQGLRFYVLVSWEMYPPTFISGGDFTLNIFCAGIFLTPDDWDKKELDENTKYYATSYPYKKLLDNPFELYHGDINEGKTKKLVCSEV